MNVASTSMKRQVALLNWTLPLALILSALLFQLGPAQWLENSGTLAGNSGATVLLFTGFSSILVFFALRQVGLWSDRVEYNHLRDVARADRLAMIATASTDAILGLDAQGRITSWNGGAERLFGYEASVAEEQPFSDLLGGSPAAEVESRWLHDEVRRVGFIHGHETVCLGASGRRIGVELTANLIQDGPGDSPAVAVVLRDITQRKQRDEETKRLNTALNQQAAERNHEMAVKMQELGQANDELQKLDQTRSEFVSLVSHQIRAPLTNMGGAVQRMQVDCGRINPTCSRMFVVFEQQVNRLDRLVQDVLNASRIEAGEVSLQPEPISLMAAARQAAREIRARAQDRPIDLRDKPGLPLAYADRDRVSEVLSNLLDNADKYSPAGKPIALQVRADQTEVTVTVHDSGPGIPPEELERIFDKFYRADSSDSQSVYGYGLGLYVCRQLMAAQNGRIWAENHPDGGAVFSIALPTWQENRD